MTKPVTHIDCPEEWKSTNDWDSHRPLLWLSINKYDGVVIEFGCGYGSTLLLHNECARTLRRFSSFESNREWMKKFPNKVGYVDNYIRLNFSDTLLESSILFIDCAPAEIRKELIEKHRNHATVLIAHDTEPGSDYVYHMADVLSTFKYRLDYQPEGKPHTTAVSNFINVCDWV